MLTCLLPSVSTASNNENRLHKKALQVALVSSVGLDLGTTLIFSGIYNVYSGAAFGVPIPVQPMKSIAAVAITEDGITLSQTLLAGFLVSTVVLSLGMTRLIDLANKVVPQSVIRGIQVCPPSPPMSQHTPGSL